MGYIEFEKQLAKKQKKRRITFLACAVLSFVLFLFAMSMREASKEVTVYDYVFYQREVVSYNENWVLLIIPAVIASIYFAVFFIVDLALCDFKTFEKDNQHITVYRGMTKSIVFVDGDEIDRIEPFSYEYVIETVLLSGVKVIISFPQRRAAFSSIHVYFSDNTPSIKL